MKKFPLPIKKLYKSWVKEIETKLKIEFADVLEKHPERLLPTVKLVFERMFNDKPWGEMTKYFSTQLPSDQDKAFFRLLTRKQIESLFPKQKEIKNEKTN